MPIEETGEARVRADCLNFDVCLCTQIKISGFLLYHYGICWCAIWVYLKLLNGRPACDCLTQTSWQVMQQASDTGDSGKPRIVIHCVKISMSKSVAVLPQVRKIHCWCETVINVHK